MVSFPSECYILEDDPNKKAILVRIFDENDLCDSAVLWVPRKAIYKEEMKGYSISNWPVKRIYVKGWFNGQERIDTYQFGRIEEIEKCWDEQDERRKKYVMAKRGSKLTRKWTKERREQARVERRNKT